LRGRAKGDAERLIILAHQTEAMARQKRLQPLAFYLKPMRRRAGPAQLVAQMKRWEKAGLAIRVRRIEQE